MFPDTPQEAGAQAQKLTKENNQKEAFAIIITCLLSVGVSTDKNDQFNRDLWRAAELLGISKLNLLKTVTKND